MNSRGGRESLDRRVEEVRRLMRERRAVIGPDPFFVDRVAARLTRNEGWILVWAARRVLPVTVALAAALTVAVLATGGSASPQTGAASISSTSQHGSDPLDWLLENRQEVR